MPSCFSSELEQLEIYFVHKALHAATNKPQVLLQEAKGAVTS